MTKKRASRRESDLNAFTKVKEEPSTGITKKMGFERRCSSLVGRLGEADHGACLIVTDREAMAIEAVLTAIREAKT